MSLPAAQEADPLRREETIVPSARTVVRLIAASGSILASACGVFGAVRPGTKTPPHTQDRAGSVHVAVLSVAPWHEYERALQPNFSIDETGALHEAIANTMNVDRQLRDVLSLSARLALPTVSTRTLSGSADTAHATTVAPSGDSTTTSDATRVAMRSSSRERQSGDLSNVATPTPAGAVENPAAFKAPDAAVAGDPFLRYMAATSLLQEVRLLQRYVRDVAIGPARDAYVMRVQVTLMPSQRDLALDAYTTLSFFGVPRDPNKNTHASAPGQELKALRVDTSGRLEDAAPTQRVRVIPILVSDNLEGATESSSSAVLRQATVGLLGSVGAAQLGGEAARRREQLQGLLGRQLNSLMTVGQVSDNTLRVRFGAMYQPNGGLGLVPRNQTVTVLVVVPRDSEDRARGVEPANHAVRIASRTDFVNANTGEPLTPQTRHDLNQRLDVALKQYGVQVDESHPAVSDMIAAVQQGDVLGFNSALNSLVPHCGPFTRRCPDATTMRQLAARSAESIWMDVGSILATLPYSATVVPLPPSRVRTFDATQRPVAVDDGKRLVITLTGDPALQTGDYTATMPITADGSTIAATSIDMARRGYTLVEFESPVGAKLCAAPGAPGGVAKPALAPCALGPVKICRMASRWEDDAECTSISLTPNMRSADRAPEPGFQLASGSRVIVAAEDRTGMLRLSAVRTSDAAKDAAIQVRIDGADVTAASVTDAAGRTRSLHPVDGRYRTTATSDLTFRLANLDESQAVVVDGGKGVAPTSLTFRVAQRRRE